MRSNCQPGGLQALSLQQRSTEQVTQGDLTSMGSLEARHPQILLRGGWGVVVGGKAFWCNEVQFCLKISCREKPLLGPVRELPHLHHFPGALLGRCFCSSPLGFPGVGMRTQCCILTLINSNALSENRQITELYLSYYYNYRKE